MVHGKVLRAPLPHARIASIDVSGAEGMPGVVAVLLGSELGEFSPYWGHAIKDRPILATERVRFAGEPVAAVAAEDEAIAEAALREIVVDYEELPVVGTVEEAIADDAPLLHEGELRPGLFHGLGKLADREGNVCYRYRLDAGSVELAEADAALTVEGEYEFPAVYQYAMETHTVVAEFVGDELTLWASCQHPFLVRAELADLFKLPLGRVRVIVPYLGGGFGSKSYTKIEPVTAALAWKAGRPVRIQNRVDESMVTTRRHGMRCRMRTTANADGKLVSRSVRLWLDTGAYADNGPRVCATAGDAAPGPYAWDAVHVDASCVYTNTSPAGSYRAFGAAHLQWIGEMQVDELARRAGIDPLEIRRRNLLRPGQPVRPDGSGKPLDADLVGDVEKAAAAIGWDEPKGDWSGRGVAVGLLAAGAHPVSRASVRMEADGSVEVNVGTTEMGQGARTVMAQIAAQELAIDVDGMTVQGADTRFTPYDRSTGASRSTTLAGLAVQRAAADLRERLLETAAAAWGIERADRWRSPTGSSAAPASEAGYAELIAERFGFVGGEVVGEGEVRPEQGSGSYAEGPVFWEICIAAAEVGVDPETGRVERRADRDDRRRRQGDQPAAGRAPGRGRGAAGGRQRAVRGDGLRWRRAHQRHPARLPRAADRGHAGADDRDHRRERRRARPLRGEGLRRGGAGGDAGGDRDRARRRRGTDERASVHARAGVAANSSSQRRQRRDERDQPGGGDRHRDDGTGDGRGARTGRDRGGAVRRLRGGARAGEEDGVEIARGVLERLGGEAGEGGAVRFETDLAAALEGADVVLEAIPEKLELKQEALAEWEGMLADDAVIASNTSGIPITKMAEKLEHPERVIGMHWSNPPQLIPMIEVIPGERTSEETIATAQALIERIGYYPCLLKKEVPGFVENRVLYAIMRECLALVDEGVIDAERARPQRQVGDRLQARRDPADAAARRRRARHLRERRRLPQLRPLDRARGLGDGHRLTGEGKLGIKTGGGLFDYSEDELAELPTKRAAALVAVRKTLDDQDV